MSVVDLLRASEAEPHAVAIAGRESTWSYAELDEEVESRASVLGKGLSGRIVPIVIEPDVAGIQELLALWRVGAIPAPLNPRQNERELGEARDRLESAQAPPETQVILWTSGSSGSPRGVALSWGNLVASARGSAERLSLTPDDVWLASLSPAHVGGLALVSRSLILGGTLVAVGAIGLSEVSDLIDGIGLPSGLPRAPTHLSLVPTQLLRLLDQRGGASAPSGLACVLVGGAHTPRGLVERAFEGGWPVALTYGATEMSSQIATAPPELTRRKPGAVGSPLPGVDLRVDDHAEIQVRGPTQALAYVGGSPPDLVGEDGWYGTGDLGQVDEEGDLWITGRRSDRIVSGGVTIDAVEIEEALRSHPAIADCCVVGLPDEEWGERVAAWIDPVVGEFDLEEIDTYLRGYLSNAKLPRAWHVEGGLPHNANGKVDRGAVRARLDRDRDGPDSSSPR